ncbi:MAG: HAD family phosphatase [Candidatus Hydrothermae bacterium]|nr:HAD family phosphatase [Candidatus Hydrothermae bacterium]
MKEPKCGVILDMDGVILDSEPIHLEATNRVLKKFGAKLSYGENISLQGIAEIPYWKILMDRFGFSEDVTVLIKEKEKHMLDVLSRKELAPSEGLLEFLRALRKRRIPIGLASSSQLNQINFILRKLGLREFFSAITSGEEVSEGKPEPQIYLETARRLGVPPERCVAIEDSRNGLISAKRAGMKVIAYRNDFGLDVDMKINSFLELKDLRFLEELGLLED